MVFSIASITNKLVYNIIPKKEVFWHPKLNRDDIYWDGKVGTFDDAIACSKSPVVFESGHAITLFERNGNDYICKNSYDFEPTVSFSATKKPTAYEHMYASNVSLIPCTYNSNFYHTIRQMGFSPEQVEEIRSKNPKDFYDAIAMCYLM